MRTACRSLSLLLLVSLGLGSHSTLGQSTNQHYWVGPLHDASAQPNSKTERVVVDAAGNTYVAGTYQTTYAFGFGLFQPNAPGTDEVFVAKIAPGGNWLWVQTISGAGVETISGLALDRTGHLYVGGGCAPGAVSFGPGLTLTDPGPLYLACLSTATGQWQWAERPLVADAQCRTLRCDPTGELLMGGRFTGAMQLGATLLNARNPQGTSDTDLFLAKFSPATRQWQWAVAAGSPGASSPAGLGDDELVDVGTDSLGNILVLGTTTGPALFTNRGGVPLTLPAAPTGKNLFVGRLTAGGYWQWLTATGPLAATADPGRLAADPAGNGVVATSVQGSVAFGNTIIVSATPAPVLARFNAAGQWQWALAAVGEGQARAVVLDATGGAYLAGHFRGRMAFGQASIPSLAGRLDAFVARITPQGQWDWVISSDGGPADDMVNDLALNANAHDGYAAGYSFGAANEQVLFGLIDFRLATGQPTANTAWFQTRTPLGLAGRQPGDSPFALSPNPARHAVRLTLPTAGHRAHPVQLLDGLGRTVRSLTLALGQTETSLDLAGLPPGLYVVRVAGQSRRLIVE